MSGRGGNFGPLRAVATTRCSWRGLGGGGTAALGGAGGKVAGVPPAGWRSCGGIVTVVGPPGPDDPFSDIGGDGGGGGGGCGTAGAAAACGGGGTGRGGGGGDLPLTSQITKATIATAATPAPASRRRSGKVPTGGGTRDVPQAGHIKGCFRSTCSVRRRAATVQVPVFGHLPGVLVMAGAPRPVGGEK